MFPKVLKSDITYVLKLMLTDYSDEDEEIHHIDIHRDGHGFGFSIRGGAEYNAPLCVLRMAEGGAAERDGRLRVRRVLMCQSVRFQFSKKLTMITFCTSLLCSAATGSNRKTSIRCEKIPSVSMLARAA